MQLKDINPSATPKRMNRIMESRFGFAIDYNKLSLPKAVRLSRNINESIVRIRKSYGIHTAERNPKYMELLLVREALNKWISENRTLAESKMGESEAILAAKDMVDSIQDMLEKVSKMQVEQMPALIDTIREQIGNEQADQFKNTVGGLLTSMVDQLTQAREQADGAARSLAGEQAAPAMAMPGVPGAEVAAPAPEVGMGEVPTPEPDQFAATDAAAGGTEAMGREKR